MNLGDGDYILSVIYIEIEYRHTSNYCPTRLTYQILNHGDFVRHCLCGDIISLMSLIFLRKMPVALLLSLHNV